MIAKKGNLSVARSAIRETLEPKKLWRTLRVRHSFLGLGFISPNYLMLL